MIFIFFVSETIQRIWYLLDKRRSEMTKNLKCKFGHTFKVWILRLEVRIKSTLQFIDKKRWWEGGHMVILCPKVFSLWVWSFIRFLVLNLVLTVPFMIRARKNWQRTKSSLCEFLIREKFRCYIFALFALFFHMQHESIMNYVCHLKDYLWIA